MPNLRGLILKNHLFPSRDDPAYGYSDEYLNNNADYGPRTSRGHSPMAEEVIPVQCNIGHPSEFLDSYDYGFEVMCNALAISDLHLQSLSVDYIYNEHDCMPPG